MNGDGLLEQEKIVPPAGFVLSGSPAQAMTPPAGFVVDKPLSPPPGFVLDEAEPAPELSPAGYPVEQIGRFKVEKSALPGTVAGDIAKGALGLAGRAVAAPIEAGLNQITKLGAGMAAMIPGISKAAPELAAMATGQGGKPFQAFEAGSEKATEALTPFVYQPKTPGGQQMAAGLDEALSTVTAKPGDWLARKITNDPEGQAAIRTAWGFFSFAALGKFGHIVAKGMRVPKADVISLAKQSNLPEAARIELEKVDEATLNEWLKREQAASAIEPKPPEGARTEPGVGPSTSTEPIVPAGVTPSPAPEAPLPTPTKAPTTAIDIKGPDGKVQFTLEIKQPPAAGEAPGASGTEPPYPTPPPTEIAPKTAPSVVARGDISPSTEIPPPRPALFPAPTSVDLYHVGYEAKPGETLKPDHRGIVWFSTEKKAYGAGEKGVPTTTITIPRDRLLVVEDYSGKTTPEGTEFLGGLKKGTKAEVFEKAREKGYAAVQRSRDVAVDPKYVEEFLSGPPAGAVPPKSTLRTPKFGEVEMARQLALEEPLPDQVTLEEMIQKETAPAGKVSKRVPPPPRVGDQPFMDWIIENGKISWPKVIEAGFKGEFQPLREWATKNKKKIFTTKETGQGVGDIAEKMNEILPGGTEAGVNELVERLRSEMFGKPSPIDEARTGRFLAAEEKKAALDEIEYYKNIENEYGYPKSWDEPLTEITAPETMAERRATPRSEPAPRTPGSGTLTELRFEEAPHYWFRRRALDDLLAREKAGENVAEEIAGLEENLASQEKGLYLSRRPEWPADTPAGFREGTYREPGPASRANEPTPLPELPGEVRGPTPEESVPGEINPPADMARVKKALDDVNIAAVFDELAVPAAARAELYMRVLRNWKPEHPGGLKQFIKSTLWKQIDKKTGEWIDKETAEIRRKKLDVGELRPEEAGPAEGKVVSPEREFELTEDQTRIEASVRKAATGPNAERDSSIFIDRVLHDDTFADIGRKNGISGEAARQIVEKMAKTLRENSDLKALAGKRKGVSRPGFIDPNLLTAGVPEFIKGDVIPKSKELARMVVGSAREIRDAFAPASASPEAARTAEIIRHRSAQMHRASDIATKTLNKARGYFSAKDPEMKGVGLDFIDTIETGQRSADRYLDMVAGVIKKGLDDRVEQVRALGTGKLEEVIENYFPHMWTDPKKATNVFQEWYARRPLEGSKAFLKKRSVPTVKEGIARGLEPRSKNPVEMALLKMREMDKYIMAQRSLADMKGEGLAKFVRASERPPEGWRQINDKISTVYGNPRIAVKEAFDKAIMDGLADVAEGLGVSHERVARMRGERWGTHQQGGNPEIRTRFAGPESVLAHEIGHAIDQRYGVHESLFGGRRAPLSDFIIDRMIKSREAKGLPTKELERQKIINGELRTLADARFEGAEVSDYYKKYVRRGTEKAAVMVEAYVHAPERFREVAPTVMDWFENLVETDPALRKLKSIKPSLVLGVGEQPIKIEGKIIKGYYYAPADAARIINNYLSPGLRGNDLFRAYLGLGNTLNQAQLGLSAFHLGFTSIDAITSKVGLAAIQASHGNIGKAVRSLAAAPTSPVTNILRGSKLLREWDRPGSMGPEVGALVEAMERGGGRARMEKFYKTGFTDAFLEALHKGNLPGAAWRLPWTIIEQSARPIMEFIVPRQKMGVFADLARYEMERLTKAGATDAQKTTALTKIWNSVDNRMGQLVYDNLFWNKAIKDLGMASIRSLGWNLGTAREVGGGLADVVAQGSRLLRGKKPELTYRTSYVIALPVVVGTMGAIMNYLFTGEGPKGLKDYFFPRTNQVDENGEPQRVSLPSYMKDIYHFAKEPGQTLKNKIHPAMTSIAQVLSNEDFYGTQIADWEGTPGEVAKDYGEYALQTLKPLGVRNMLREKKAGAPPLMQGLQFAGITPAPVSVSRTQAESTMARMLRERAPNTTRTKEQAETYDIKRQVNNALKSGRPITPELEAKAATLSKRQVKDVVSDLKKTYFEDRFARLSLREALRVYAITTPEEKKMALPLLARKISTAAKNDPAMIEQNIERIRAIFPRKGAK